MIELLQRLGYRPRFAVWELTLACNMRCLHCGSFAGPRRDDELGLDESLALADELAALGCEKVTLGGGEPTLRPEWDQIARRLVDRGVRVNIISNGWTWSDDHVRRAREAGLMNVGFSLDGFEPAHDHVRRQGSFARVVAALAACRAGGLATSVVTHVNKLNYRELAEFRAFLGEQGVGAWQIQLGNPSGTMGEHRELVIPPEDLLWLIPEVARLRQDKAARPSVHPGDNVGYFGIFERDLRDQGGRIPFWVGCRAGMQVIGIESNGNVKGCLSMPSSRHGKDLFLEGNLRESSLTGLWRREEGFAYNRAFTTEQLGGFCAVCRYKDICRGGCAWTAYSHTANRFDNPYCFYRQAVIAGRHDLLGDDAPPTEAEAAWVAAHAAPGEVAGA